MATSARMDKDLLQSAATSGRALLVFLRGVNVGGHRAFRPKLLAETLCAYDVVNVGAAGTFVVRKPGKRTKFLADLRSQLPFDMTVAACVHTELVELAMDDPFGGSRQRADIIQFVSVLTEASRHRVELPLRIPESGPWLVRIIGMKGRFVYGFHRRQMKAIGCLGQIDKLFGVPATTRSWSTLLAMLRVLL